MQTVKLLTATDSDYCGTLRAFLHTSAS